MDEEKENPTKGGGVYRRYTHEDLKPEYNKDTRILIVGSFSPNAEGYYQDPTNCMRKLLAKACGMDENTDMKSANFLQFGIGFFDIIQNCYATEGFKDSEILEPAINPELFNAINNKENKIEIVVVTGQLAWKLFCEKANLLNTGKIIYKIPSTSGYAKRYGLIDEDSIIKTLKWFIKGR